MERNMLDPLYDANSELNAQIDIAEINKVVQNAKTMENFLNVCSLVKILPLWIRFLGKTHTLFYYGMAQFGLIF